MKLSEKVKNSDNLRCTLCPHMCKIKPGERGICGARENRGDEIELVTYGIISGYALDPVEKKPLYHFYPGSDILSIGSYGCNMKCDFCQNYHISQFSVSGRNDRIMPEEIVGRALREHNNIGIAYTYNEPVIWHEYVTDCAKMASKHGLKNVMVTNGYINPAPLSALLTVIDAFNVDLKAFDDSFYKKYTGTGIKPVLNTLTEIAKSGKHLEITTLIIPGLNDSVENMQHEAGWISANMGKEIPLHISRYYPMYMRTDPPTPEETIFRLYETASEHLDYVYTGNIHNKGYGSDTICPGCHRTVISRRGYKTSVTGLDHLGRCITCSQQVINFTG